MGMATTSEVEVKDFLEQCKVSGNNAYNVIKGVLERLHNEDTRADARKLLAAVQKYVEKEEPGVESMAVYHFRLHQLSLTDYEGFRENRQSLTLLELPSIFVPEDWSFTFFEGISRHPDTGFRNRDVTELGCGNGWVSIAMAERWQPRKGVVTSWNWRAVGQATLRLKACKKPATSRSQPPPTSSPPAASRSWSTSSHLRRVQSGKTEVPPDIVLDVDLLLQPWNSISRLIVGSPTTPLAPTTSPSSLLASDPLPSYCSRWAGLIDLSDSDKESFSMAQLCANKL